MRQSRSCFRLLILIALCLAAGTRARAQEGRPLEQKIENPAGSAPKPGQQGQPAVTITPAEKKPQDANTLVVSSLKQEGQGDVLVFTGEVRASDGEMTLLADRVTWNKVTNDVLAEGNVFFDQEGQKLAGERLELNLKSRRGTIYSSTAFTNRTPDGTIIVAESPRVDKTGVDTYVLDRAMLTACEEPSPKWSFTARRARIRADHKAKIYNAFFRIKGVPVLYIPYASISIAKIDRSSGLLIPTYGNSSIKGRTIHVSYYQTLGDSADLKLRTDIYTERGFGLGVDFRAKTGENSRIAVGTFIVFDRVLGPKEDAAHPNQGGSSFYADAVQHFSNGFVAVADINITSSVAFRQVFAENIQQAISPEERSQLYLNRNWNEYSFNALYQELTAYIGNETVRLRQLPSIEITRRPSEISDSLPVYFSMDASVAGVKRTEQIGDESILKTPSLVQRLDVEPTLTLPLRSVAGFTLTPSVSLRGTFYSDSLDPVTRNVVGDDLWRRYGEFSVDLRPPAFERVFHKSDGSPWFKHIIEPFVTYRRIAGIDDFQSTIRTDEVDEVVDTSELEYGITNRFFIRRPGPDGSTPQAYELLDLTLTQKYFFDPTFGGALREGVRNQFYPLDTVTPFAYGGTLRDYSPLNVTARVRPSQTTHADVQLDYDTVFHELRNVILSGGLTRSIFSINQSWFYTRRIPTSATQFDPSTFPGNELDTAVFAGNSRRGPYGGVVISYDLRNQEFTGMPRDRRLINLTATGGWAWDCCSLQVQTITFKAGLRNENRILFAFTLKGIGTFGTENIGQKRRVF
jgi:LPS-assembly protein